VAVELLGLALREIAILDLGLGGDGLGLLDVAVHLLPKLFTSLFHFQPPDAGGAARGLK